MLKINSRWTSSLIILQVCLGVICAKAQVPTLDFPSGLQMEHTCGLQDNVGTWNASGSLTIHDMSDFDPRVAINGFTPICQINLNECSPVPSSSSGCFCTSNTNNVYGLLIQHYKAEAKYSQNTVKAVYRGTNFILSSNEANKIIGSLPLIFARYKVKYEKNGIAQGELLTHQTVSANSVVNLSICVENLVVEHGRPISLKLDDCEKQRTKAKNPACISKQLNPIKKFNFTFIEMAGCKRNDTFTINLVQECLDGWFGLSCNKCNCRNRSEICNKTDGNCDSGCPLGWQGDACTQTLNLGDTEHFNENENNGEEEGKSGNEENREPAHRRFSQKKDWHVVLVYAGVVLLSSVIIIFSGFYCSKRLENKCDDNAGSVKNQRSSSSTTDDFILQFLRDCYESSFSRKNTNEQIPPNIIHENAMNHQIPSISNGGSTAQLPKSTDNGARVHSSRLRTSSGSTSSSPPISYTAD